MDLSWITMFVNSSKVGGWTRAGVGALFTIAIAKWPWLSTYVDSATQAEIGVAVSGIAVGIWSHIAKSLAANAPNSPGVRPGGAIGAN